MVAVWRPVQLENADELMFVTPFGILSSVMAVHPLNASEEIDRSVEGNVKFPSEVAL